MQDKRLFHRGIEHGGKLRGVCTERAEEVCGVDVLRNVLRRENGDAVVVCAAAGNKMLHERMAAQLVKPVGQILPERHLAEREVA